MKKSIKVFWISFAVYSVLTFLGTLMIEQNENNLGFLINMKGYIPLMKYYTFLGLLFFAVAFFSMWRTRLRIDRNLNRLEEEKRELKAAMYDLKKKTGFVLYSPVFQNNKQLNSPEHKKNALKGFTAGVFRMEDEIKEVFSALPDAQLFIKIEDQSNKLYSNFPDTKSARFNFISLHKTIPVHVANRIWTVNYKPSAEFYYTQLSWTIWWLLLSGFIIISLTGMGLLMLSGRTLRTEELVRTRTRALAESEEQFRELVQAQSAIVWRANSETFQFTFVSDEAEKLLGYPVRRWLDNG